MFIPFGFTAGEVASASYLLDDYGSATVAYSLRKLSSSSTNAIRVRRSSDNTEQDIGFVGEDLDTSTLTTFTGAGEGYITKWYDQSGNSNDAIQTTTASQPLIVSGGTVESVNSKPALTFDSTDDYFDLTSNITTSNTTGWAFVLNRTASNINQPTLAAGSSVPYGPYWFSDQNVYYAPNTSGGNGKPSSNTGQNLLFADTVSNVYDLYINNIQIISGTTTYAYNATNYIYLGRRSTNYFNGKFQEFILWDVDQGSNRTDIQDNINTYYSVY
jgi:hypothetical protein